MQQVDLLIIGGGINGVAVACDAAGRGLSVLLCDKGDLACATSNSSTKLIHGGLRYLEQFEFGLVKKALHEREVLMRKAPFLIHPLEFILPYERQLRPAWMLQCGMWLYDFLDRQRSLPHSRRIKLTESPYGDPLNNTYTTGFSYYDCRTDDARLVVLNARAAKDRGAEIRLHTACTSAKRTEQGWVVDLLDNSQDEAFQVLAKAVVNAAGPWVEHVARNIIVGETQANATLVQGSHFVIPRCYEGDHAYIFQTTDKRIVVAVPYQEQFTLIGTTDTPFVGDPGQPTMTAEEVNYLCEQVGRYFNRPITPDQIVWQYSGVRTLYGGKNKAASQISRDFHLEVVDDDSAFPVIHIFGGKITTHRVLAESVMHQLSSYISNIGPSWTANVALPGGDLQGLSVEDAYAAIKQQYLWMPQDVLQRYWCSYGSELHTILGGCHHTADLGQHFGAGLYAKEVDFMVQYEWASDVEDILWRRSKLGLFIDDDQRSELQRYLTVKVTP